MTPGVARQQHLGDLVLLREGRVVQRLAELGSTPEPQARVTPEAHRAMLDAEISRWRPILQAAGEFAD